VGELFCPKCGRPVDKGELFCSNCGASLSRAWTPAPASEFKRVMETPQWVAPPPPVEGPKRRGKWKVAIAAIIVAVVLALAVAALAGGGPGPRPITTPTNPVVVNNNVPSPTQLIPSGVTFHVQAASGANYNFYSLPFTVNTISEVVGSYTISGSSGPPYGQEAVIMTPDNYVPFTTNSPPYYPVKGCDTGLTPTGYFAPGMCILNPGTYYFVNFNGNYYPVTFTWTTGVILCPLNSNTNSYNCG